MLDVGEHDPGCAGIFSRRHFSGRIHKIDEVMRRASTLFHGRFRGTDIQLSIERDRIAVDDLPGKLLRQRNRKRRLTACGGAENHHVTD